MFVIGAKSHSVPISNFVQSRVPLASVYRESLCRRKRGKFLLRARPCEFVKTLSVCEYSPRDDVNAASCIGVCE